MELFDQLSNTVGLPADQLKFVCCLLLSYVLSFLYLWVFPVVRSPHVSAVRHIAVALPGLFFAHLCYGLWSVMHYVTAITYSYFIMRGAVALAQHTQGMSKRDSDRSTAPKSGVDADTDRAREIEHWFVRLSPSIVFVVVMLQLSVT
jgi:hypothetical protein